MNKNEIIIVSSVIASAVIGYLTKAAVDNDTITQLKNDLKVTKFKHRVVASAFDVALDEVPGDRAEAVKEKIETIVEFEKTTASLH